MNAPHYLPRHGSLAERVIEWFRKNPDEELSRADVAMKFEVSQSSVQACLQTAVDNGELIWVKRSGNGSVYRSAARQAAPGPAEAAQAINALPVPSTTQALQKPPGDLYATVSADRRVHIAFTLPPAADPNLVMAAMLIAAAQTLGVKA